MSEANNYVCFNVDQSGNHSEPTRLRARNNIGAAGLSSLAASFESRAPSYVWSAGEVCTYGGALWQFDADHSGAWTGADAHKVSIVDIFPTVNSLNLNDYSYEDLIDDVTFLNGFNRRGTDDEFVRYYHDLSILSINMAICKNSSLSAPDWVRLFTLTHNEFWFSDATDSSKYPVGVLGINNGAIITNGVNVYKNSNNCLLLSGFTGNKSVDYKDLLIQSPNYGCFVNRCYCVVKK